MHDLHRGRPRGGLHRPDVGHEHARYEHPASAQIQPSRGPNPQVSELLSVEPRPGDKTRVKRWRDGQMALRWCAAGMVEASSQFRRVNGHLAALRAALERHVAAETVGANSNTQDVSAA